MTNQKKAKQDYLQIMRRPIEERGSKYSSTNSSKGALLTESDILFSYLARNNGDLDLARHAVINEDILAKKTYQTRKRCWDVLHSRYFPNQLPSEHLHPIVEIYRAKVSQIIKRGILYFHFATSALFAYQATVKLLYGMFRRGLSSIGPRNIHEFLDSQKESHPEIKTWSYQTRLSLVGHYLSAVRDFGLLEGKARKRIHKPMVDQNLLLYIVTILRDCGKGAKEIMASDDFKLFLLSSEEVEVRLAEAHRDGRIKFRRSGQIVSLELPWETIYDYIKRIR